MALLLALDTGHLLSVAEGLKNSLAADVELQDALSGEWL